MKFSGKMCLKIILKITKNQGFTLSLKDVFFEKAQGGVKLTPYPPSLPPQPLQELRQKLDRIDSNLFEVDQLKDLVSHLDEEMKKLSFKLEDTRNRGLRKTLIFKSIPFQQQRPKESWDESKEVFVKEILKALPEFQVSDIIKKIKRAHRSSKSRFNDWDLAEKIKSRFIWCKSSIYVSQMYSPTLTKQRNTALIAK